MLAAFSLLLAAAEPVKKPTVRWIDPPTPAQVAAAKRAPVGPGPRAEPAPDVDPETGMILRVELEKTKRGKPAQNGTGNIRRRIKRPQ